MVRRTTRSLLLLVVTVLIASIVIFSLLRLLGGDVATVMLGKSATPESLAQLRAELGLNKSLPEQYWSWISGFATGDLGTSQLAGYEVSSEVARRMPITCILALASLALSEAVGFVLGVFSALNVKKLRGSVIDTLAQIGLSIPRFWAGILLVAGFAVGLGWFPASGFTPFGEDSADAVRSLILPIISLSVPLVAILTRFTRSAVLEVVRQDYIDTARAKGFTTRQALMRDGLRNASITLVTVGVLQLGSLIAGTVVVEKVFNLPGIGTMLLNAVLNRDVIVVQSVALILVAIILVMNFLMDLAYGLMDPRIRNPARDEQY